MYSSNGILLNTKKNCTLITHSNIDECQKHYKKPHTKKYMLFLYEILSRQTAYGPRIGSTVVPRNGDVEGDEETFGMDGNVLRL